MRQRFVRGNGFQTIANAIMRCDDHGHLGCQFDAVFNEGVDRNVLACRG